MQHLDEGTIHSWLDGALAPDEAARVEAHVAECPECAAAVAEARGFIAASSRILTALDNAPRGVIPVAAPKRRVDPIVWRVAATLLVVAAGTLAVFRNGGREAATSSVNADTGATMTKAVAPIAQDSGGIRTTAEPASPVTISGNSPRKTAIASAQPTAKPTEKGMERKAATDGMAATSQALAAAPPSVNDLGKARASVSQPNISARENNAVVGQAGAAAAGRIAPSGYANAEPAPPRIPIRGMTGVTGKDSVTAVVPLKIVGTKRQIGAKITLYEVTPNDTVTLTELTNVQLESVVVTGMSRAEPMASRSAGKAAAVAPPERADAAVSNGVTTITWTDGTTGSVLKLSGRIPAAQLQQIKIRIEQERAAAAAAARKKP